MKRFFALFIFFLLWGCASLREIEGFDYALIEAKPFEIASWSRVKKSGSSLRIYIEGDGYAWRNLTTPSNDPTPTKDMMLILARTDPSENVIYLARPCQYISSSACTPYYWTDGRFSLEVIESMETAIHTLMKKYKAQTVELVGYSGGGAVAALIAARQPYVSKLITVAGVLDHKAWTAYHKDTPLKNSLNPASYKKALSKVKQVHYVGAMDKNVPSELTEEFIHSYDKPVSAEIIIMPNATHDRGWIQNWPRLIN